MPVMTAEVTEPTAVVSTWKPAVVAPAATVTLAGTVAAASPLERVTTAPPAGAGLPRVTVPEDEDPPASADGLSETDESVGAAIDRVAVRVLS